jgi:hypothetical protein
MKFKVFLAIITLLSVLMCPIARAGFGEASPAYVVGSSLETSSVVLSSIEVDGNDTYTIENGRYVLNDTITIKENATLIIRNAVLEFNMTYSTILYTYDNATIDMLNASISHVFGYFYAYFYDKTSSAIGDSMFSGSSYFYFYDTSTTFIANSKAYRFRAYENATVTIANTGAQYFYCYGFSKSSIISSQISYLYVYDSSSLFIADSIVSDSTTIEFERNSSLSLALPRGYVEQWSLYDDNVVTVASINLTIMNTRVSPWNVYCYDTSKISIADSAIDNLGAYGNSTVTLENCTASYVYVYDYCSVTLIDSTVSTRTDLQLLSGSSLTLSLVQGHFSHWNLHTDNAVVTAYINLTLQNSNVTKWSITEYNSTVSLTNCSLDYSYLYSNSTLSVYNSTINGIYSYSFSSTTIMTAMVNYFYLYESSTAYASETSFNSVYAYGNSSVSLNRIRTEYLGVGDYATLLISNSLIAYKIELSFVADSDVSLDSLPDGAIRYWNLYENATIVKAYINLTLIDTKTRGWSTITVSENSTVSISNSIVDYFYCYSLSQTTLTNCLVQSVDVYDNSSVFMMGSAVGSVQLTLDSDSDVSLTLLPTGWVDYWNLYENASVVKAYVNFTLSDSWIREWGFSAQDSSVLSITQCTVSYVYAYSSSKISMDNCTIESAYAYSSSSILLNKCSVGSFGTYDKTTITLIKTIVRSSSNVYDESTCTLTDSDMQSRITLEFIGDTEISNLSLPTGLVSHWSLNENATVKQAFVKLAISNTRVKSWGFYIYGSSKISFMNCSIEYLSLYDLSSVSMENCTVETLRPNELSRIVVTSIPNGKSIITNLNTYGMSTTTLIDSRIAIISAYSDSTVEIIGADYAVVRVYDRATVQISWSLEVHMVDQGSHNVPFANVTVTDETGAPVSSAQAGADGWAHLTLVEKVIDVTESHPAGAYNVTCTYGGFSSSEIVEMTDNKQIAINLPFTISEFPLSLITPIAAIFLTLFAIVLKKLKWPIATQAKRN